MVTDSIYLNTNPLLLISPYFNYFKENRGSDFKGVYMIKILDNEKIYIGSSVNIKQRVKSHFYDLRNNKHPNKLLQRAFNKYGETSFFCYLMEDMPKTSSIVDCQTKEQFYLDTLKCFSSNGKGYNISEITDKIIYKRDYEVSLKDPDGNVYEFYDKISDFCRIHNLKEEGIRKVVSGKLKFSQGWSLPETPSKPIYSLQHEDGTIEHFDNFQEFGRKHNLCPGPASGVFHGKRKSINGWYRVGEIEDHKKTLINYQNESFTFTCIDKFCREQGLNRTGICNLLNGHTKYFLGWRMPQTESCDEITYQWALEQQGRCFKKYEQHNDVVYELHNIDGRIEKFNNKNTFAEINNLQITKLFSLLVGDSEIESGWYIPENLKTYWTLISPEGDHFTFSNLKKFCMDHHLSKEGIRRLINKTRNFYHGWHRSDTPPIKK